MIHTIAYTVKVQHTIVTIYRLITVKQGKNNMLDIFETLVIHVHIQNF